MLEPVGFLLNSRDLKAELQPYCNHHLSNDPNNLSLSSLGGYKKGSCFSLYFSDDGESRKITGFPTDYRFFRDDALHKAAKKGVEAFQKFFEGAPVSISYNPNATIQYSMHLTPGPDMETTMNSVVQYMQITGTSLFISERSLLTRYSCPNDQQALNLFMNTQYTAENALFQPKRDLGVNGIFRCSNTQCGTCSKPTFTKEDFLPCWESISCNHPDVAEGGVILNLDIGKALEKHVPSRPFLNSFLETNPSYKEPQTRLRLPNLKYVFGEDTPAFIAAVHFIKEGLIQFFSPIPGATIQVTCNLKNRSVDIHLHTSKHTSSMEHVRRFFQSKEITLTQTEPFESKE